MVGGDRRVDVRRLRAATLMPFRAQKPLRVPLRCLGMCGGGKQYSGDRKQFSHRVILWHVD
ncbi:MAG: hypothetical protein DMF58_13495 [Acidobacteria bacterium]|nr:MAG: hypothetical protein DMF58_13495 [Acidobacteriota bacterium]